MNGKDALQMRTSLGLSRPDVVKLTGGQVSIGTIRRFEHGEVVGIDKAQLIADVLGLELNAYGNASEGVSYVTTLPSGKSIKVTITELE